jgi:hypothetical protein
MKNISVSFLPFSILKKVLILAFFLPLLFNACDNPDTYLLDVEHTEDRFDYRHGIDTFSVVMRSIWEDSLVSDELTRNLLGTYKNDTFGQVSAHIYTEFRLPAEQINFGTNLEIDSIVLRINYKGPDFIFGKNDALQSIKVFELNESMYLDSFYYSTRSFSYDPLEIGSWTGKFNPADSVLTIHLNEVFKNKLLSASPLQLNDDIAFLQFFKGLAIKAEDVNGQGAIAYFLLHNSRSNISIYYHNLQDTGLVRFLINSYCARHNQYVHDYQSSLVQQQINSASFFEEKVYLQPMAGIRAEIQFPYLKNLVDSGFIAIHKALLDFPVDMNSPYKDRLPASLILLTSNQANQNINIADRYESHYGGTYDPVNQIYRFGITRYVQQLLKDYYENPGSVNDFGLRLIIPSDNPVIANPLILKNHDLSGIQFIKLRVYYTKL